MELISDRVNIAVGLERVDQHLVKSVQDGPSDARMTSQNHRSEIVNEGPWQHVAAIDYAEYRIQEINVRSRLSRDRYHHLWFCRRTR